MKKLFISAFMALAFCIGSNAETISTSNAGSSISEVLSDDSSEGSIAYAGLSYYEGSSFALNFRGQNWNATGIELNFLTNKDFDFFEVNMNLNYSFGLWKESDKIFLFTLAAGPTFTSYKVTEYDNSGKKKEKDKYCSNLIIDPYFAFKISKFTLSAGYMIEFNKWKFKQRGEAFHVGLGYCF